MVTIAWCPSSASTTACCTAATPPGREPSSCWSACATWTRRCASGAGGWWCATARPSASSRALAEEVGADAVHFSADVSPFARARGEATGKALHGRRRGAVPASGAHGGRRARRDPDPEGKAAHRLHALLPALGRAAPARGAGGAAQAARAAVGTRQGQDSLARLARPRAGGRRADGGGRGRGPRADVALHRRRRRATTPTTTTRSGATAPRGSRPICASAASRRASWRTGCPAARARRRFAGSSAGATSTSSCCCITPTTRTRSSRLATADRWSGRTTRMRSGPGRRVAPASRWWTPACASCGARASCTTAPGWSSARS